jgi:asparagine synthase (glutamine-hydrolysing)
MCGILAYITSNNHKAVLESKRAAIWERGGKMLKARGPEFYGVEVIQNGVWVFTRLAINGLNPEGNQPFTSACETMKWMCNGEIYNSKDLSARLKIKSKSGSDCEVIGPMWEQCEGDAVAFARSFDGVFAIVLHDMETGNTIVARDPYGVRPLFWGIDEEGSYYFGSERKSICNLVDKTYSFPPGEVWEISSSLALTKRRYHTIQTLKLSLPQMESFLFNSLQSAVLKRLMTERPIAACLSGGLDSSLVCAFLQAELKKLGKPPLKTFSIGMKGGSDLEYARMVAEFIGSDHTEIIKTADEMFDAIPHVIRDIESYDITTVRASVGNWLLGKYIAENSECKVVFNGDGSDEEWGSYAYLNKAPTDEAYERECERLLYEIHLYDVLRSDRCISSHGLEPRTPFLDKELVASSLCLPTSVRRPIPGKVCEKWFLRKCCEKYNLLPEEVLWRKKEAFSDGVSSTEKSWFMEIQERVKVPEGWETNPMNWFPRPPTPEAYYYRMLFETHGYKVGDPWEYWMPRWSPETNDPSARTLSKIDT